VTVRTLGEVSTPVAVDCVVVSYNSAEDLPDCLSSVADQYGVTPVRFAADAVDIHRDLGLRAQALHWNTEAAMPTDTTEHGQDVLPDAVSRSLR